MNIGELLKKLRLIYSFKAVEVCSKLNISPSYLSEIEHNKRVPSLELLEEFAKLFDIKLSTLILISEEYAEMRKANKAEIAIQKKMIKLVNKYASGLEEFEENDEEKV